jgi:hypothetical protein
MTDQITKKDFNNLSLKIDNLEKGLRSILDRIDESDTKILAAFYSENLKLRQEIGYQQIILKSIEDNFENLEFSEQDSVSSKIEISMGPDIFGFGAKWLIDIDTTKEGYVEILDKIQSIPNIPKKVKEFAIKKLKKFKSN